MINGLVSIITPCFNGQKYIAETIESVLAQTYEKWEMIIVDDGSTDDSMQIIEAYANKDNRIHFYKQKNAGSSAARNTGISNANGQYIALLDADDLWRPDFLKSQIEFMKSKNAVCVTCAYGRVDDNSRAILTPVKPKPIIRVKDMLVMNRIGCLTGLYDTSKYGKVYLRTELKSIRDDYAYWLDIVKLEGVAYGNPETLADYRILRNSTTGNKIKLVKKQYEFYRNYVGLSVLTSFVNTLRWGMAGVIKFTK